MSCGLIERKLFRVSLCQRAEEDLGTLLMELISQLIHLGDILADDLPTGGVGQRGDESLEGEHIIIAVVRMGKIGRPEETI